MPKKLSIDFARSIFEDRGWTLTSTEYINAHLPLSFICENGHHHQISFSNCRRGKGCGQCPVKSKVSIDNVSDAFNNKGWTLLSKEYAHSNSPLDFICENEHHHQILWSSFKKGGGCGQCFGKLKLTIEFISSAFEKKGWTLLSTEYVNSDTPLDFICEHGHQHQVCWDNFRRGNSCAYCAPNGFNLNRPGIFYYVRIAANGFDKPFYKVGITNKNDVNDRLRRLQVDYSIVDTVRFKIGYEAYKFEQDILIRFSDNKVPHDIAKTILPISGHTELFDCDILNADSDFLDF